MARNIETRLAKPEEAQPPASVVQMVGEYRRRRRCRDCSADRGGTALETDAFVIVSRTRH